MFVISLIWRFYLAHILHSFAYCCVFMLYNVFAEAMYLSYERLLYTENAKNN